ncbi:MAG: GGDEF domain-containing protein [Gaiellaceae bacterium]
MSRLVRAAEELPALLAAIARTVSEALGYETVVINLYRPAWNDFEVTTVRGSEDVRHTLLGQLRSVAQWESLLCERFERRGAYVVPAGAYDWSKAGTNYTPAATPTNDADAWHPEDALFLPMRHSKGHVLGIISVDEPANRRRPTDEELDVLVSVADHAAHAVESSQEAAESARHRLALEHLLRVSSRLAAEPAADDILRAVCSGVRDALGFQNVIALLVDPHQWLDPRAAVGWNLETPVSRPVRLSDVEPLLDPAYEIEGCYLLPNDEAERRVSREHFVYHSLRNGSGPWAWNRHWLLVPLRDSDGEAIGMIAVDEPDDRLLPTAEKLQALRIFANQAAGAIVAAANVRELQFLADHDPLTRLLNRRAFVDRLEGEVSRATRYGRAFGLVLADLDEFKVLNDRFGHQSGDEALQRFARTLQGALRKGDDAFRIGGDEFALMLAEATEDDAREVVGRISDKTSGMRVSFGVATCPDRAADAQTLFRRADEALYEAKRSGTGVQFVA